ncbi:MAG TPA: glycosyltransferase family 2 protein [Candidatus Methylacidiphilales bacterium]|nr:glycosyltransferase family 2 protein [Candidatus Methylacidiphilales bacterium]
MPAASDVPPPTELAVVMPVYNEEANIASVAGEWTAALDRLGIGYVLLAINDGSRDGTAAALRQLAEANPGRVEPVDKPNAGHGRACRTGYELAVARGAAWTLQIDSDGQCDPGYFAEFWQSRAEADAVFGLRKTRDDGFLRVLISGVCSVATSALTGLELKDPNVPYRLIRTEALQRALTRIPADFDMQNVALTLALKRDRALRWRYIPIHFRDRQGGTNSINLRRILGMGLTLVTSLNRIGK